MASNIVMFLMLAPWNFLSVRNNLSRHLLLPRGVLHDQPCDKGSSTTSLTTSNDDDDDDHGNSGVRDIEEIVGLTSAAFIMPYSFSLPTPGPLLFQSCLSSPSHPQLPYHATTARHALRIALKRYKKSTRSQRQDELLKARNAVEHYLSWLVIVIEGAGYDIGRESNAARPEIEVHQEIEAEWSAVLFSSRLRLPHLPVSLKPKASPTIAGSGRASGSKRVRHPGFAYELAFTLTTYAFILSNLARSRYLHTLYASHTPAPAERTASLQSSTRDLQLAASIHAYISTSPFFAPLNGENSSSCPPDVQLTAQSGLKSLCLAEATLLSIAKDDGYLFACIQLRNERDTDWMIKAPDIPRVRTLLFARICVRAAELASEAEGAMMAAAAAAAAVSSSADKGDGVIGYTSVLARVARARACRFFGIEAEDGGRTGEGIAWLRAGRESLLAGGRRRSSMGHDLGKEKEKSKLGFRKWKEDWREKREERRLEKGAGEGEGGPESDDALIAGDDAGRMEEVRILEWLSGKWEKMNNTMNTQHIPPHGPLMSQLPSGRDILPPLKVYIPEGMEKGQVEALRGARVSPGAGLSPGSEEMESSSDEEVIRDYF